MANIDTLFRTMLAEGASDLHLVAGQRPTLRIHGELERLDSHGVMDHDALHGLLYEITPTAKKEEFDKTGDVDFGYELPGMARFRANFFQQKYGCAAVFGQIPSAIVWRKS
jgi:twitching motility protein PilT